MEGQHQEKSLNSGVQKSSISKEKFGTLSTGEEIELYRLTNANGMMVEIITYGGIITTCSVPDRKGRIENVVLGFDNLRDYEKEHPFFGALVGRYGNRIAQGKFSIDGREYSLPLNNGDNHLHGGNEGFDKKVWTVVADGSLDSMSYVSLQYLSPHMEMGYPGNMSVQVTYKLTNDNALIISYKASTDQSTICNLTQHSYFNLSADFTSTILNHELLLHADHFIPVDEGLIPTGELQNVNGPFDFRSAKRIGADIEMDDIQLHRGGGYDHCYVLTGKDYRTIGSVYEPESGRLMTIETDQPGVQLYTGNFLDNTLSIPGGGTYGPRSGFCLETQHFPDSPNQANFPSVVLEPGETYSSKTVYKFSAAIMAGQ